MKQFAILVSTFLILCFSSSLFSQDRGVLVILEQTSRVSCVGEQLCATVRFFSTQEDITDISVGLQWDEEKLNFESIRDLDSPFSWTQEDNVTQEGNQLNFSWNGAPVSVFRAGLFEVCWTLKENINYANEAPVEMANLSFRNGEESYEVVASTSGFQEQIPSISSENQVITIEVEEVCIPIVTDQFFNATAATFAINWDENLLKYKSISLDNSDFDGLLESDFSRPTDGSLQVNWNSFNGEPLQLNQFDSRALMHEVCFEVLATTEARANIGLVETLPAEIITSTCKGSLSIKESDQIGKVTIFENGMSVEIPDSTISQNTDFICLPLKAKNIEDLVGMQLTVAWDAEVLQFNSLNLDNSVLTDLTTSSFNTNLAGHLNMSWIDVTLQGVSVEENDILFETCFDVLDSSVDETQITVGRDQLGIPTEFTNGSLEVLPVVDIPGTIRFREEGRFIFPGDANEDKQSNHFDLLHVGLGYNATGTSRADQDIDWTRKYSRNWAETSPVSQINYKHSDTNGDSKVDEQDVEAILQNWGEIAEIAGSVYEAEAYIGEADLFIEANEIPVGRQEMEFPIILGTEDRPISGAYGLAFSISYDYEGGNSGTEMLRIDATDSWLGENGEDLVMIYRHFPAERRIDVALSRIDQSDRSGAGKVASITVAMEDVILLMHSSQSQSKMLKFKIQNVRLINSKEEEIEVSDSEFTIDLGTTNTKTLSDDTVSIYPSVPTTHLHISSKLDIQTASITDLNGRLIRQINQPDSNISIQDLEAGMYLIQLNTLKGQIVKKFVIQ